MIAASDAAVCVLDEDLVRTEQECINLNITPTPITAALAGIFAAIVMPILWSKSGNDSIAAMAAFLLVVALPAHAFVVGFRRNQAPSDAKTLDVALLKRIGIWFFTAIATAVVMQVIRT